MKPMLVERSYRKMFDMVFNLGFGQSRSDTYVECDSLRIRKKKNQMQIEEHHMHAESAYAQLKSNERASKQSSLGKVRELTSEVEKCSVEAVDMYSFTLNKTGRFLIFKTVRFSTHTSNVAIQLWSP